MPPLAEKATALFFVLFSVLSTIWVLIMGAVMWRKARVPRLLSQGRG